VSTEQHEEYLSKARLRAEFGLTDALVARLGPPDRTAPNPHYRKAAPMQLYARERVAAWVSAHAEEIAAARRRSKTAKMVARSKARDVVAAAEKLHVSVEVLDDAQVRSLALASYNAAREFFADLNEDYDWQPADADADPAFLERITVNYIRHELTDYDRELERVAGQVGVGAATAVIRRRVYEAIAEAYPQYADECRRQWRRRTGGATAE
jgi:hypothetical protein